MNMIHSLSLILFSDMWQAGIIISVVGYTIVFLALLLLFFVFESIPKLLKITLKRRKRGETEEQMDEEVLITGEVNAAISAALYLYFSELHDEESNVITIKRVSKRYSPWSSKIYGLGRIRP